MSITILGLFLLVLFFTLFNFLLSVMLLDLYLLFSLFLASGFFLLLCSLAAVVFLVTSEDIVLSWFFVRCLVHQQDYSKTFLMVKFFLRLGL